MPTQETQQAFKEACEANDAARVARILEACPPAEHTDLFFVFSKAGLFQLCADKNHFNLIPVLAHYFPEKLDMPDMRGQTPFLRAADHFSTETMIALAKAGANIRARTQNIASVQFGEGAVSLGMRYPGDERKTTAYRHGVAMRELGLDINGAQKDGHPELRRTLRENQEPFVGHLIDAGANFYHALNLPAPRKPLRLHEHDIKVALRRLRSGKHHDESVLLAELFPHLREIVANAPTSDTALTPDLFLEDGQPTKQALQWEALSILPLYFSPHATKRWKGGIEEVVETASRMPFYMHDSINIARTEREMPTPRTHGITAAYASNTRAGQGL